MFPLLWHSFPFSFIGFCVTVAINGFQLSEVHVLNEVEMKLQTTIIVSLLLMGKTNSDERLCRPVRIRSNQQLNCNNSEANFELMNRASIISSWEFLSWKSVTFWYSGKRIEDLKLLVKASNESNVKIATIVCSMTNLIVHGFITIFGGFDRSMENLAFLLNQRNFQANSILLISPGETMPNFSRLNYFKQLQEYRGFYVLLEGNVITFCFPIYN